MVDDKMCIGIIDDSLMARIGPDTYQRALAREGCKEMTFTGRPMQGFVLVEPEGTESNEELAHWIQLCLDYNPKARSSKKGVKRV